MRRLTKSYKRWLLQRSRAEFRRKRRHDNARLALIQFLDGTRQVKVSGATPMPARLCLDEAYEESISFFYRLRKKAAHPTRGCVLWPRGKKRGRVGRIKGYTDFVALRQISAGAALVLAAEYDRIARLSGRAPATVDVHKWDPIVATVLSRLGFFELLQLAPYEDEPPDAPFIEKMISKTDTNISEGTAAIRRLFDKIGGSNSLRVDLGSAVTDGVENVVGHAYPPDQYGRKVKVPFWWFLGSADPISRHITLVIYDQGITIPKSLPAKWALEDITRLFLERFGIPFSRSDTSSHGRAIDAAMRIGATSTNQSNRGKGLAKILEIIRRCPEGRLRIVSGCGECVYSADGVNIVRNHDIPLMGTYVELMASFGDEEGGTDGNDALNPA